MPFPRPVLAALLAAALSSAGGAHSEPGAAAPAQAVQAPGVDAPGRLGYYRMAGVREHRARETAFGLAAAVHPAVAPGTTDWLARGAGEPLAPSYASPHAGRKEVGISYSSDGRVDAYVARRARADGAVGAQGERAACCSGDSRAVPPGSHYARGGEPQAVASLIGRLKAKGLKLALDDGWKLSAGARSREYSNSFLNSRVAHVTLQRWWGNLSTGYALQLEKRGGWNVAPSLSLQLGYAFAPRSTVGFAYTTGQELAFFGAQGMLKTEVRSYALQAEHAVRKNWSLRFDAGYYDHGALPSHRAVRIAFQRSLW